MSDTSMAADFNSRAHALSSVLSERGFSNKIDADGDICFYRNDEPHYLEFDEGDPYYIEIALHDRGTQGLDMDALILAAWQTTLRIKLAKVLVKENLAVSFSVQTRYAHWRDFVAVLDILLSNLDACMIGFKENINSSEVRAEDVLKSLQIQ